MEDSPLSGWIFLTSNIHLTSAARLPDFRGMSPDPLEQRKYTNILIEVTRFLPGSALFSYDQRCLKIFVPVMKVACAQVHL